MAGDIFISKDRTWTTGTIEFNAIVALARSYLERSDKELAQKVYEPLEEELDFLDLEDLSADEFKKVYAALSLHFHVAQLTKKLGDRDPKYFAPTIQKFESLLKELGSDARARTPKRDGIKNPSEATGLGRG